MPVIVGIDPGVSPTVCVLVDDPGHPLSLSFYEDDDTSFQVRIGKALRRRPSAPLLRTVLRECLASLVVIEDVHSLPNQGVASTFAFGYASGMCEGVACGLGLRVLRVQPQVWRKGYRLRVTDKQHRKAMSRHIASNLVPHLAHHFNRVRDHNRAEAFLMAYWARGRHEVAAA